MKRHRKRAVLKFLADGQPRTSAAIARAVSADVRSIASYMRHLESQGLVIGGKFPGGLIEWEIQPKGLARLRWFQSHAGYDFMRRRLSTA